MKNNFNNKRKRYYKLISSLLIIVFVFPVFTSCDSGSPKNHPLYRKATLRKKEKKFDTAIELYENFLLTKPNAYGVHLELAKLYTDHGNDKVRELYHYKVYLDNTPRSTERDNIEQLFKLQLFEFGKNVVIKNRNLLKTSTIKVPDKAEKTAEQLHKEYVQRLKRTLKSFVERNKALILDIRRLNNLLSEAKDKLANSTLKTGKKTNITPQQQEEISYKNRYFKIRSDYQSALAKNQALQLKLNTLEKFLELIDKKAVPDKVDSGMVQDSPKSDNVSNSATKNSTSDGADSEINSNNNSETSSESSNLTTNKSETTAKEQKAKNLIAKKSFFHKVKAGESLSSIALKYYGNKKDAVKILNANRLLLKNKNKLDVDMYLLIPKRKVYE